MISSRTTRYSPLPPPTSTDVKSLNKSAWYTRGEKILSYRCVRYTRKIPAKRRARVSSFAPVFFPLARDEWTDAEDEDDDDDPAR